MIEVWVKFYLVSDNKCNIMNPVAKKLHKVWQLMFGLHLALVT